MNYKNKGWLKSQIDNGKSPEEISNEAGAKLHLIYKYIDKFGLKTSRTYLDKEWLKKEYIVKNKSIKEISKELNISTSLLKKYIAKFKLSKINHDASFKDKSYLIEQISLGKTIEEIGRLNGVTGNAVKYHIDSYGIKIPTPNYKNYDWLFKQYITLGKSSSQIAFESELKCPRAIQMQLKKFGITNSKEEREARRYKALLSSGSIKTFGGKSLSKISTEHGIPTSTIYQGLKRLFGSIDDVTESDIQRFINGYSSGKTSLEIFFESVNSESFYNKYFDLKMYPELRYKPDFKIDKNTAVNVDGLYWHSDKNNVPMNYHFKMRSEYEKLGLRVYQFRSDEVIYKSKIVSSIISNHKGLIKKKIFGRKTVMKSISQKEADIFLTKNHLMGTKHARHLSLLFNGEIVSLISFKITNNTLKIERFCSSINTVVIGGLSKLISGLEKNPILKFNKIESWVDLRYGNGKSLESIGFSRSRDTLGWKWTDGSRTYSRLRCRANMDDRNFSEKLHAEELGWYKIYDAGQRLYIKSLE